MLKLLTLIVTVLVFLSITTLASAPYALESSISFTVSFQFTIKFCCEFDVSLESTLGELVPTVPPMCKLVVTSAYPIPKDNKVINNIKTKDYFFILITLTSFIFFNY